MDKKVRVRIAPSPTGDPHVGTAYIALFNYVFAKKNKGDFIIRIEDTDRERSTKRSEELILHYIKWLGLNWVEGPDINGPYAPYRQSERQKIYKKYAEELLNKNAAYRCFCTEARLSELRDFQKENKLPPGYDGKCRHLTEEEIEANLFDKIPFVIRLRMPKSGQTIVKDELRGEIIFENVRMDDQVLLKSDDFPTYHLANVVDDHLMEITHVIRAEEWIPSTPKHILLYEALGWKAPQWIHMPLLRNDDKSKISKRKNDTSLEFYHKEGYLKEAMLNFLALMGWSLGEDKEIFSIEEMIENFTFDKISLGGPVFNVTKLKWLNRNYMKMYDIDKLYDLALPFYKDFFPESKEDKEFVLKIIQDQRETSDNLKEMALNSMVYIKKPSETFNNLTLEDREKAYTIIKNEESKKIISLFKSKIEKFELNYENIKITLEDMKKELSLPTGKIFPVIRIFLTGEIKGSELAKIIHILGKKKILERMNEMESYFYNGK